MPTADTAELARKLRDAGHHEAALTLLLDLGESPAAPGATAAPTAPAAPAATSEPVEGVDYLSHAALQQMTRDEIEHLRANEPEKWALSWRMLGKSTKGRPYRA